MVHEHERKPEGQKMNVLTVANQLAVYTIQICKNQKIFIPDYQTVTNDLIAYGKNIFIYAWNANNIRVLDKSDKEKRLGLQKDAIQLCNNLLAEMQIAKKLFHLTTKRVKYWGKLTNSVKSMLEKWHESDITRYNGV